MLETRKERDTSAGSLTFGQALNEWERNWVWKATHALLDHQDFDESGFWIASRLGVSVDEAIDALEGLCALGLASKEGEKYRQKKTQFILEEDKERIEARVKGHKNLGKQILTKLSSERRAAFYTHFSASNKTLVAELYGKITQLFEDFDNKSKECTKDGVYAFSFTGVDIMEDSSKGGVQ